MYRRRELGLSRTTTTQVAWLVLLLVAARLRLLAPDWDGGDRCSSRRALYFSVLRPRYPLVPMSPCHAPSAPLRTSPIRWPGVSPSCTEARPSLCCTASALGSLALWGSCGTQPPGRLGLPGAWADSWPRPLQRSPLLIQRAHFYTVDPLGMTPAESSWPPNGDAGSSRGCWRGLLWHLSSPDHRVVPLLSGARRWSAQRCCQWWSYVSTLATGGAWCRVCVSGRVPVVVADTAPLLARAAATEPDGGGTLRAAVHNAVFGHPPLRLSDRPNGPLGLGRAGDPVGCPRIADRDQTTRWAETSHRCTRVELGPGLPVHCGRRGHQVPALYASALPSLGCVGSLQYHLAVGARRFAGALLGVLTALTTSIAGLAQIGVYGQPHPWIVASQRLYERLEPGSIIGIEAWDHPLPVPLPAGDVSQFVQRTAPLYDDESAQKLSALSDLSAQADVLVIASRRGYGALARWPLRFPETLEWYAGSLHGRSVEVYTRCPRIGPVAFSDDPLRDAGLDVGLTVAQICGTRWAVRLPHLDESFRVYDAPLTLLLWPRR